MPPTYVVCERCGRSAELDAARAQGWQIGYVEEIIAPDDPNPRLSDDRTIRCPDHRLPVAPPGSGWQGAIPAIAQELAEQLDDLFARERWAERAEEGAGDA